MRRLNSALGLGVAIFLLVVCNYARVQAQRSKQAELRVATKLDEYGQIGGCDHSARLDNFAITLQNDPSVIGYVVVYGPEGEKFGTAKFQFSLTSDYLVNSRGLDGDRIKFVYAGRNSDLTQPKIELWLAPHDAEPPDPRRYETNIKTFTGKFAEYQAWDVSSVEDYEEGPGLPVLDVKLASFADMLKEQKGSSGYVAVYNGSDAVPGAWRRVADRNVDRLRELGVETDRVKMIYGGKAKRTQVQLWISPKDAPAPVSTAGPEALPEKAVEMATFSDYQLGSEENQVKALRDLVEVLRLNEKLRACLIVRLESLAAVNKEEEDSEAASPKEQNASAQIQDLNKTLEVDLSEPEVGEIQPADLPKLVQNWMVELAAHKMGSDRIVVLFVPTREYEGNTLETWIAPLGIPLPDPFAEESEPSDDSEPTVENPPPAPIKPPYY